MKRRFEVTYRVHGQKGLRRVTVTVEDAGKRDAMRLLKEKVLRSTRRVGFRILRITRKD